MGCVTSKLNKTPPMGEPKATEIPAAAAADRTSRFLAKDSSVDVFMSLSYEVSLTFVGGEVSKELHQEVGATTSNMNKRPLFS